MFTNVSNEGEKEVEEEERKRKALYGLLKVQEGTQAERQVGEGRHEQFWM